MAPPWEAPKQRRWFRGLTGNALATTIISVVLAGITSFLVAHYQSQDSARQAIADQQTQEVIQLESDVKSYFQYLYHLHFSRRQCSKLTSPKCKQLTLPLDAYSSDSYSSAVDADRANISDATLLDEVHNFDWFAEDELIGGDYWSEITFTYDEVITRCGELIQGKT